MPPQFTYTHHQKARFIRHRQISLFCPVLKGMYIGQGPPWGFQSGILVRQVIWQEHPPFDAFWHRMHSVLLMVPKGLTSDSRNLKGCANFLSQLLRITCVQYGSQLLPPVRCIWLVGLPFQPYLIVIDEWLWWWALPIPVTPTQLLAFLGSAPVPALGWVEGQGHSPPPPVTCPWGSPKGLLWRMSLPPDLEKLHASLAYGGFGDWACLPGVLLLE